MRWIGEIDDQEKFPADHPEIFHDTNNLASVLLLRGDLAEAERLMRRAREIAVLNYGPQHHEVALVTQNLAKTLTAERKWTEAESTYRTAIDMAQRTYPEGHYVVAFMRANLGELLVKLSRFAEAESALSPALETIADALGPDHPRAKQAEGWLREAQGGLNR